MRAVMLRQVGGPEALVPESVPDPAPGPEEVLVRVRAAAVCGRDRIDRRGGFPMMKLPTILGHELAGEVVSVGGARGGCAACGGAGGWCCSATSRPARWR